MSVCPGLVSFVIMTLAAGPAGSEPGVVGPPDGGFEVAGPAGQPAGWRLDQGAPGSEVHWARDGAMAHSGSASLTLSAPTPCSAVVVSEPLELRVGRLYRLAGWIRCAGVRCDPAARYPTAVPACLSMESFPFTNHSPAVGGDSDWTPVETLFLATRSVDRVRLHLGHNGGASGQAWFDDLRVEEVERVDEFIPMETVRWCGEGCRYDDRGWIFVHVEGSPYARGYQYGTLVANEIVQYISKLAVQQNEANPAAGWEALRFEADALFLRGYDPEYLTEMQGIADGAQDADAKYGDRGLDLVDIVTVNSAIDLSQLHRALSVTPHALTGEGFLEVREELRLPEEQHKCSAFAATGPATADGQVVFGQLFMWSGYTGVHWNVICDIVPEQGHRLVYQTFPGGIHSGADFYINSAGILIGETTVAQTPFEPDSTPQSNRIRKAAQYASSIDDVERMLWEGNNGMYTNDWPIADVKTGEVAILLLGTHRKKLWRTGEDLAPFGTPGFLWANNNNRDPEVRKEYRAQPDDRPFDVVFAPWNRDVAFVECYARDRGRMDSNTAVRMWASSPINRAHACDGKITTTEMARELAFLAHHGKVTLREKFPQPGSRIMPTLPGAVPHLSLGYAVASPIFVTEQLKRARDEGRWTAPSSPPKRELELGDLAEDYKIDRQRLWRSTVYPATDAENWFVSATAAYWQLLNDLVNLKGPEAAKRLSAELASLNRRCLYTVSREADLAAVEAQRAYDRYAPYQIPRIKGTFALHQLRLLLGNAPFFDLMRAVHERFVEQDMTNAQLLALVKERAGDQAAALLQQWVERPGLPELRPAIELRERDAGGWELQLTVDQGGNPYRLVTHVQVDTGEKSHVRRVDLDGPSSQVSLDFDERPECVVFNALNDVPVANPHFYTWANFVDDFDDVLIVYGTARQDEANHTLARRWQETLADAYTETLPPLVKDSELSAAQAAGSDLLLMGTLGDNRWIQELDTDLPVRFGLNHFAWRGLTYGAPGDGLFLVLPNPLNPQKVAYVIAANSALQLYHMTRAYNRDIPSWARFKGGEIVEQGYHAAPGFEFEGL